jgi:hypothetical protein
MYIIPPCPPDTCPSSKNDPIMLLARGQNGVEITWQRIIEWKFSGESLEEKAEEFI